MDTITSTVTSGVVSDRYTNTSAIKTHALKCSKQLRAGYFQRVGADFITDVQAEIESVVRKINGQYQPSVHPVVDMDGATFITGAMMDRVKEVLNQAAGRIIQAKVQRHPSCGKTLKT